MPGEIFTKDEYPAPQTLPRATPPTAADGGQDVQTNAIPLALTREETEAR